MIRQRMPEQVRSQHLVHRELVYAFIADLFLLRWLQLAHQQRPSLRRFEVLLRSQSQLDNLLLLCKCSSDNDNYDHDYYYPGSPWLDPCPQDQVLLCCLRRPGLDLSPNLPASCGHQGRIQVRPFPSWSLLSRRCLDFDELLFISKGREPVCHPACR